ncbi:hypothetical protein PInf_021996 [Phytophthora infestans]|nr:hypothetical protein PInf_021996 [Phytophthora infestans]
MSFSAPNSPSSRATTAPSDSASTFPAADVVDVTGGEETWTNTSARSTSDPPPIRTSKRAAARNVSSPAPAEARKGKKKAPKRTTPSPAATTSRAKSDDATEDGSDHGLEDKAATPKPKRAKNGL